MPIVSDCAPSCASVRDSDADRDHIVLSANELRDAHRIAVNTPHRAMTYLAEAETEGFAVHPRTAAKYLEAARFVVENGLLPVYDAPKPEPTVTHTYSERVLPAIQTDPDGSRYLEAADGSYRFTFVEHQDLPDPDFAPHVIADADPEMSPEEFAVYIADGERFAREITRPVEASLNRDPA